MRPTALVVRHFDPQQLDRSMLPNIETFRRPDMEERRRRTYYGPANLVSKIVAMCKAANIEVEDVNFLTFKRARRIDGRNGVRWGAARPREWEYYNMYRGLKQDGVLPPLFREILAEAGWQALGYAPIQLVRSVTRASQLPLRMGTTLVRR